MEVDPGRFEPPCQLISEAASAGKDWPPLVAGLCSDSAEKFAEHAQGLAEAVARRDMW
jgi:hypothetical protein